MNFWTFAAENPVLTVILAIVAGLTLASVAHALGPKGKDDFDHDE